MAFIPLIFNMSKISTNSILKYFLIQSFARLIFLFSIITRKYFFINELWSRISTLSIRIKLGICPTHFWFPQVIEGLRWAKVFILSTWQKIIPFYILRFTKTNIIYFFIIISAIIRSISLINISSLRKILAFSRISHLAWISLSLFSTNSNWILYLTIYRIILLRGTHLFITHKISNIGQLQFSIPNSMKLYYLLFLLSLRGIPPLLGFLPKWLILTNLNPRIYLLAFFLISRSLLNCFFYLRSCFRMLFFNPHLKLSPLTNPKLSLQLNLTLLILAPLIFI